ncbi:hypothetical protein HHK36_028215 [Tetracentron sinense]|uniref:Bet v I/Major latex protein domain-containing protein n=1 Tax=Tetracentron sinense TaxID=13715 RepID=A0A835D2A5_TETSI|nr:hypothetical protein HHK36_028215 [Tetracentron sinense]
MWNSRMYINMIVDMRVFIKISFTEEEKMHGKVSHEKEVGVPASIVWDLYGTLKLGKLVDEMLPNVLDKVEVLEGDGGVGTVLKLTYPPGNPGFSSYTEKFMKIDNEKRFKEAEVIEGGYLDLGFQLYRVRFDVIEKDADTSIIKSTIEYEIEDESAANVSFVTVKPLEVIAELAAKYLTDKQTKA